MYNETPQHGKRITIDSYYDGVLASTKQEYEVSIFSTKESILKDVIESLGIINSGETRRLTVEIVIDSQGRYRLVKKWIA